MDIPVMHRVNAHLGVEPLLIDAKHVSLASRPRLWWIDTDWLQSDGEHMHCHTHYTEVVLPHNNSRLDVLDQGHVLSSAFRGNISCITGYRPSDRPPIRPHNQIFHSGEAPGEGRLPSIRELERLRGLPIDFTLLKSCELHEQHVNILRRDAL
eukprot:11235739-Karenia_brevis.AAC.1